MDSALGSEPSGCRFESCRARQPLFHRKLVDLLKSGFYLELKTKKQQKFIRATIKEINS